MEVIWIEGQRYVIVPNNTHWPSIITNLKKRVAPISEDMVLSNLKDTQQRVTTFQPSAIAGRHAHKEGNFRRTVRIILTLLVGQPGLSGLLYCSNQTSKATQHALRVRILLKQVKYFDSYNIVVNFVESFNDYAFLGVHNVLWWG